MLGACLQTRMNGGTCIAAAIQKAGQLLKGVDKAPEAAEAVAAGGQEAALWLPEPELAEAQAPSQVQSEPARSARVLVLLTDGRVDSYQVRRQLTTLQAGSSTLPRFREFGGSRAASCKVR